MRIHIHDEDNSPQRYNLLGLIGSVNSALAEPAPQWMVRRASGYGETINRLDTELDEVNGIEISIAELASIATGVEEWFHELVVEPVGTPLSLGLVDSSYMFVDGPPEVVKRSVRGFSDTRIYSQQPDDAAQE